MDEIVLTEKIRELILDSNCHSFMELNTAQHNYLLSYCIAISETDDWLYDSKIFDKIIRYVLSDLPDDAQMLAKEIKLALIDYYDVHIEELFESTFTDITAEINQDAGLKRRIDPINGEVTWER